MSRPRELIARLRRSPRTLGATAVVAVLLAAAVLDVPGRLGDLAPPGAGTPATPRPAPTATTDPGRLSPATDAGNRGLGRCTPGSAVLARCGPAPALSPGTWLNTPQGAALRLDDLRGSVVLLDFFSASCLACARDSRYLLRWQDRYAASGLRVVGVHSPELALDDDVGRLTRTLDELGIDVPVLHDARSTTLAAYRSEVLPSRYLVDRDGEVRAITLGEGGAFRIEGQIRRLLAEGRPGITPLPGPVGELDDGEDAGPGTTAQINLGDSRGARYDSESDTVVGEDTRFRLPRDQPVGTFSLGGLWRVGSQEAVPVRNGVARVTYRGRSAYQLVSGSGSLVVTDSAGTARRIRVDGEAQLRQIHTARAFGVETLTVRYEGDLSVYAFAFG